MITSLVLFSHLVGQLAFVPTYNPYAKTRTVSTKHFHIHYPDALKEEAGVLSKIAERIYTRVTTKMRYEPSNPVHVVLRNDDDQANGLATPVPYNTIYLTIAPPGEGSSLDDYDNWLTLLFTHEFTHTTHVGMVEGVNKLFRALMGTIFIPNAAEPQWLIEGLAEYNETTETTAGRGRSSYVDMHLRTASIENKFLPIEKASYWYDEYPLGNAAYWYGIGFHQYLDRNYGEKAIVDFAHTNARWPILGFLNFKTAGIFGKSFDRMWNEWTVEEKEKAQRLVSSYKPQKRIERVFKAGLYSDTRGAYDPETKTVYWTVRDEEDFTSLRSAQEVSPGAWKTDVVKKNFSQANFSISPGYLYFSKSSDTSPFQKAGFVSAFDLKSKKSMSLFPSPNRYPTPSQSRPVVAGSRAYLVERSGLKTQIVEIEMPNMSKLEDMKESELFKLKRKLIYKPEGFSNIGSLGISPNGSTLVFSMAKEGQSRDLYLLDISSQTVARITSDLYQDYFPVYENDHSILFSSDRPMGPEKRRVFNIYRLDLNSKLLSQITDTWTGAYYPIPAGDEVFFANYRSEGFEVSRCSNEAISSQPLVSAKIEERVPSILETQGADEKISEPKPYRSSSGLLPRYLLPFWLASNHDNFVGLATGSNDPLGKHLWTGLGYYFFTPKRPGGVLGYQYRGFGHFSVNALAAAGIENYGQILVLTDPSSVIRLSDYYERSYMGTLGISYSPSYRGIGKDFSFHHFIFGEDRRPLLPVPSTAVRSLAHLQSLHPAYSGVRGSVFPESGQRYGLGTTIRYSPEAAFVPSLISPRSAREVILSALYSPKFVGSDFNTFTTTASYREYDQLFSRLFFAADLRAGVQWMDALYQKSFRLGGTGVLSRFAGLGTNEYPLRGLGSGALRGEGVVSTSVELRVPITRDMPGFGTAPLWWKNLHLAAFTDVGQTFQHQSEKTVFETSPENFKWDKFTQSVGGELRTDASILYGPPISLRFGYGRVLYLAGENVVGDNIKEFYFSFGPSF